MAVSQAVVRHGVSSAHTKNLPAKSRKRLCGEKAVKSLLELHSLSRLTVDLTGVFKSICSDI